MALRGDEELSARAAQADANLRLLTGADGSSVLPGAQPAPPGFVHVYKCGLESCPKHERLPGVSLRKCAGCRQVVYCSETCQQRDWPLHKPECMERRAAVERLAAAGVQYEQGRRVNLKGANART